MEEKEKINEQKKNQPNKKMLIIIAILLLIVSGKWIYNELGYVSTDDAYVETNTVQVSPKVSGQLVKVLIEDNQQVKKGDLIAVIEDNDYKIKLAQATAKYEQALQNQKTQKQTMKLCKLRL